MPIAAPDVQPTEDSRRRTPRPGAPHSRTKRRNLSSRSPWRQRLNCADIGTQPFHPRGGAGIKAARNWLRGHGTARYAAVRSEEDIDRPLPDAPFHKPSITLDGS